MKVLLAAFLIIGSTTSFAQTIQGYKVSCTVTAADTNTGKYTKASKVESFLQGSSYKIDFPSLIDEQIKSLTIHTTTENNNLIYNVLISGLKRNDKVLAIKFDVDGDSISKTNEDFDRKEGFEHVVSINALSNSSLINVRGTISDKNKIYVRVVKCSLSLLGIH